MKNKFIQKSYGKCLFYCLANMLNNETILDEAKTNGFHVDGRRIVEKLTEHTLVYWLKNDLKMKPFKETNAFDQHTNFAGYAVYIASVQSSTEGVLHCLLVLVDTVTGKLTVLDPHSEDSVEMTKEYFLNHYNLYELETLAERNEGAQIGLPYEMFSHLTA